MDFDRARWEAKATSDGWVCWRVFVPNISYLMVLQHLCLPAVHPWLLSNFVDCDRARWEPKGRDSTYTGEGTVSKSVVKEFRCKSVGLLVDQRDGINKKAVISSWLIVGKLRQGIRYCKFNIVEMYTCSNTALGRKRKNGWFCFLIFQTSPLFLITSFLPNMCVWSFV